MGSCRLTACDSQGCVCRDPGRTHRGRHWHLLAHTCAVPGTGCSCPFPCTLALCPSILVLAALPVSEPSHPPAPHQSPGTTPVSARAGLTGSVPSRRDHSRFPLTPKTLRMAAGGEPDCRPRPSASQGPGQSFAVRISTWERFLEFWLDSFSFYVYVVL